jgi:hypothetical protein
MKFKSFILSLVGIALIGVSIGFVLGFYTHKYLLNNYLFYLPVLIMGIGCVLIIYATLVVNKKK